MLTDDELLPLLKSAFDADTRSVAAPDGLASDVRRRIATRRRTAASVAAGAGVAVVCAVGAATLVSGGHHSTNVGGGGPSSSAPAVSSSAREIQLTEANLRSDLLPTPPVGHCLAAPPGASIPVSGRFFADKPRADCLIGYKRLVGSLPAAADEAGPAIYLAPPIAGTRTGYRAFHWPAIAGYASRTEYFAVTGYETTTDKTFITILRDVTISARPVTRAGPGAPAGAAEAERSAAKAAASQARRARTSISSGRP